MATIGTIVLPTRPQPDTIVAIFLLKEFGKERFPGIEHARVETAPELPKGETFETMLAQGTLALDLGGGVLDHHGKARCTTELVADYLGIANDPALGQLLAYAKRDDKDGKGTISRDALDRAFGLSGLIAALNKAHPQNPNAVVDAALPLLAAHYLSAREHHVELPQDVLRKKESGHYEEHTLTHGGRAIKLVCVVSDKPSMPTYLRSERGGRADVVLQRAEERNHLCVLSRQDRNIDLAKTAALIRLREAELAAVEIGDDEAYLMQTGRIEEVPYWYYDPATNSLLNGGAHNRTAPESLISWEELKAIVRAGLTL
jgi:hypothetical protein